MNKNGSEEQSCTYQKINLVKVNALETVQLKWDPTWHDNITSSHQGKQNLSSWSTSQNGYQKSHKPNEHKGKAWERTNLTTIK